MMLEVLCAIRIVFRCEGDQIVTYTLISFHNIPSCENAAIQTMMLYVCFKKGLQKGL